MTMSNESFQFQCTVYMLRAAMDVAREDRRELRNRLAAALWEARKLRRALKMLRGDGPGAFLLRAYDSIPANPPWHDEGTP